jgi:Phage capsid family
LKTDLAPDVLDRRRPTVTPAGLVEWWDVPTREYTFATVQETSRANGQRYGGMTSTWGLSEVTLPPEVDGKTSLITFVQSRLLIFTTVSRDIWEDAQKLERWLNVVALSEVRFNIDFAIVNGVLGGPTGIINSPCTVTAPKGSTGPSSISSANIDDVWSAMYAGSRENCVWMASDDTIQKIDQLGAVASGSQWAETPYIGYVPAGRYGQPFPTLKGRPLIACEACPIIGSPGDLICWDPTDYIFTYLKAPSNIGNISISVDVPPSKHATGMIGLPENALERRMSDQFLYAADELAITWKFRGDGRFLWSSQITNLNGALVGPAAIIQQR